MPALLTLWFTGVLLLLARLCIGLIIARRMKSATTQPPPRELLLTFHQLARRIGVSRPVQLLHSALVQVPTVIGWLRPVVLIPVGCLMGLSTTQVEAILAHELAHIRRHDYLVSVLQSIVEAVLFYHPAVWWASQQIRREREHCCDDLAVKISGDPLTYARALSLLEEHRSTLPAIALGANGGVLTMRIQRLLGPKQNPIASQLAALTILGIVIAASAIGVVTTAHAQGNQTRVNQIQSSTPPLTLASDDHHNLAKTPATNRQLSTPYQAWIDQDVRWIMTPAERSTFLGLTTDTQRDNFIEHFWTSRNPDNNTPANSYREEHYRRIAYTNQHFATTATPGWQTDRGHIYIVNGPPNTVDSHPSPAPGGHAYEVWVYGATSNSQAAEFNFIDTCNCGFYQLQSQSSPNVETHTFSHNQPPPAAKPTIRTVSYKAPIAAPQQSTPPASSPARISAGVMAGEKISNLNPIYPPAAKAARIHGAVVLHAIISKTGDITDLEPISGPEELRDSAMTAVRQWKYHPYVLNGEPQEVSTTITVNYNFFPADPDDDPAGIIPKRIGGSVSAPHVISSVDPEYTEQARKDKISGTVLVRLWVNEQGLPSHIRVTRGIGAGLDEKALEAVRQYKFTPAMEDGRPVVVELNIEVNFKIF